MVQTTNKRGQFGLKYSSDQYRKGGQQVLWLDGMQENITLRVVSEIRAAGFKCWRTGSQVWVRAADQVAISALNLTYDR